MLRGWQKGTTNEGTRSACNTTRSPPPGNSWSWNLTTRPYAKQKTIHLLTTQDTYYSSFGTPLVVNLQFTTNSASLLIRQWHWKKDDHDGDDEWQRRKYKNFYQRERQLQSFQQQAWLYLHHCVFAPFCSTQITHLNTSQQYVKLTISWHKLTLNTSTSNTTAM